LPAALRLRAESSAPLSTRPARFVGQKAASWRILRGQGMRVLL